jgi:hypothetical protein
MSTAIAAHRDPSPTLAYCPRRPPTTNRRAHHNYPEPMAEYAGYLGRNRFLRWWPKLLLVLGAVVLYVDWNHAIQWATLFAAIAYVHGRWLPWQFAIREDGLALTFPFGRHLFLPRSALTVRIEVVGAIAMVGRRRHFGYLLMDRIGYEPDGERRLRSAFTGFGYNLI